MTNQIPQIPRALEKWLGGGHVDRKSIIGESLHPQARQPHGHEKWLPGLVDCVAKPHRVHSRENSAGLSSCLALIRLIDESWAGEDVPRPGSAVRTQAGDITCAS